MKYNNEQKYTFISILLIIMILTIVIDIKKMIIYNNYTNSNNSKFNDSQGFIGQSTMDQRA